MIFYLSWHLLGIFGTSQPSIGKHCTLCIVITPTKFMSLYDLIKFVPFLRLCPFGFVLLVLIYSTYFMNNIIIISNRFIILWT
jgi:hypothetical protein